MKNQSQQSGFHPVHYEHLLQVVEQDEFDSYKTKGKLPEPTACPDCGVVFHQGRWQWLPAPANAHQTSCPACHRIRDQIPAGYVSLSGDFFAAHEQEILKLIQNHATKEKAAHPLQRLMDIEKTKHGTQVTTTDIRLARGIGVALQHAYQGELEFHHNPEHNLLRVNWAR